MRIAAYARVSTAEGKKFQNPETQLRVLRESPYLRGNELVGEYVDFASGRSSDRPNYQKMKQDLVDLNIDAVLFYDHSRFMRSQDAAQAEMRWFRENKKILMFEKERLVFNDGKDDDPGEVFQFQILQAVAEFVRRSDSRKVVDGIARVRVGGKPWGRPSRKDIEMKIPLIIALLQQPRADGGRRTIDDISEELHIPASTLRDHLRKAGIDYKGVRP